MSQAMAQHPQVVGAAPGEALRARQQKTTAVNRAMAGTAPGEALQAWQRQTGTMPQVDAHVEMRLQHAPAEPRGAARCVVLPRSRQHRQARATPADHRGAAPPARAE